MSSHWLSTVFGDFAHLEKGISYKSSELCEENEGLPFINLKSIDRGGGYRPDGLKWYSGKFKNSQVVEPGDLLLCCTDLTKQKAILGYPILVPDIGYSKFCISLDLAKIVVDESRILKSFLFLLLQDRKMREFMQSRSSGTTVMHLKTSEVPSVEVALPPLAEQKRIVDLISSVDSYIEALRMQFEKVKQIRSGLLEEMLNAGGHGWFETSLDNVTKSSWGNTETTKSKYVESGYLAYSASGADGFLEWFEHEGTAVVLSAIGAQCGKTWFAQGQWTSIKNTIWLKSDNINLLDKYLFYLSNREQFWQIRGQAQPFISLGDVKKTKVLLPPLSEQRRIIEIISSMDELIDRTVASIEVGQNLRSALLTDLLSGTNELPSSYDKVMAEI